MDTTTRCPWCGDDPLYRQYHDSEWGVPCRDDGKLFEFLLLESAQAGLSWITVLRKRENFRAAFGGFTVDSVAAMSVERDMARLLSDPGIIRHRGKIEATLGNARCARAMRDDGVDLARYFWSYAPDTREGDGVTSPASVALSKDLKKRGWRFVGPTTVYSFMQSMGMVNDHSPDCHVREECDNARRAVLGSLTTED